MHTSWGVITQHALVIKSCARGLHSPVVTDLPYMSLGSTSETLIPESTAGIPLLYSHYRVIFVHQWNDQ